MAENSDITMIQLLNAVNNLTTMVNDLKNENETLKETKKIKEETKQNKENKLEILNKTNKNLNNNYLYIIENPLLNNEFIKKTNDLNDFYEVFKFYLNNVFNDYFKKNDITWIYHKDTNRLYVYDKYRNNWKQLGYQDLCKVIDVLRNKINFAFMTWITSQKCAHSEEFKNMYIKCCGKYFNDELTIKDYDKMKHYLYKYLKNMN